MSAVNAHGHQNSRNAHMAVLSDLFIASVQVEISHLAQWPFSPGYVSPLTYESRYQEKMMAHDNLLCPIKLGDPQPTFGSLAWKKQASG